MYTQGMMDSLRFLCVSGIRKIKAHGKTFTIRANAWGNWYGYVGTKKVELFWGDYTDQAQSASEWLDKQVQGVL